MDIVYKSSMVGNLKKGFEKIFSSPTLMSWMSFGTKSLSLFVVLPLLVKKFSAPDVAIWYLYSGAMSFIILADLGFSSTLVRMFSYARAGLAEDELYHVARKKLGNDSGTNIATLEKVWQVMNFVYARLSLITIFFISVSSFFLYKPILRTSNPSHALIAWIIVIITSFFQLRYSVFSNYLQGMNKVALVKKWETIFNMATIISNFLVLLLGGDILMLVISNQFWVLVTLLRDYFLSTNIENNIYKKINTKPKKNKQVFDAIWPSAWKSGLGTLFSFGLLQITNMLFAKEGDSKEVASYLMAYNLIRQVSTFSQAAFYSRIPTLARLRAEDNRKELIKVAQKGMQLTYWVFIIGVIGMALFGTYVLPYIKSNIRFPDLFLWALLGLGILLERFGAMHIQLYSTANKIIWHIANGVTGCIFLLIFFLFKNTIGLYVFPIAILFSNLLFYSWYSAYFSYKSIQQSFFFFEKKAFIPALIFMSAYVITAFLYTR